MIVIWTICGFLTYGIFVGNESTHVRTWKNGRFLNYPVSSRIAGLSLALFGPLSLFVLVMASFIVYGRPIPHSFRL